MLEIINVKGYRREIHRKKYKRACRCPDNGAPQIITPPPVERVIPKSIIGISIWALHQDSTNNATDIAQA